MVIYNKRIDISILYYFYLGKIDRNFLFSQKYSLRKEVVFQKARIVNDILENRFTRNLRESRNHTGGSAQQNSVLFRFHDFYPISDYFCIRLVDFCIFGSYSSEAVRQVRNEIVGICFICERCLWKHHRLRSCFS